MCVFSAGLYYMVGVVSWCRSAILCSNQPLEYLCVLFRGHCSELCVDTWHCGVLCRETWCSALLNIVVFCGVQCCSLVYGTVS
jgi:hypothetical protein